MMKHQCLGRGGKTPIRRDSRASLQVTTQKPKNMLSTRSSVTEPSEGKVIGSVTSASQRDRSLE